MPRCWVMVLGDVGRSPRMQYHASSLCKTVRRCPSRRCRLPRAAALRRPCPAPHFSRPATLFVVQPGYEVVLVGYRGAALIEELQAHAAAGTLDVRYLPDL